MILFDIEALKNELNNLHKQTLLPNFWNDLQNSTKVTSNMKKIENKIDEFEKMNSEVKNLMEMNELLLVEEEIEMEKELLNATKKIEKKIATLELQTLLSGKYDINNAIVTLHPRSRWYRVSGLG